MSRLRNYAHGVTLAYLHQIITVAVGFFLTPFYLKYLGDQGIGLWLIAMQVVAYLALVDIGIVALVPREIAFAKGSLPKGARPSLALAAAAESFRICLWQLPAVALGIVAIWYALPLRWEAVRPSMWILLVGFGVLFPLRFFPAVLEGLQEFGFLGILQLVGWSAGTLVSVWLVLRGWGVTALVIGWLVTQTIVRLAAVVRLAPSLHLLWAPRGPDGASARREKLQSGLWVSTSQIAQVLLNGSDMAVLGRVAGPSAVTPYSITSKLAFVLGNKPAMLAQASAPGLSEIRGTGVVTDALRVANALTEMVLLTSGAVCLFVVAVNRGFIEWWVGGRLFLGEELTALILINMILRHFAAALAYTAFSFGREKALTFAGISDGIFTLCLSVGLTWTIGPIGIPIAGICGSLFVSLPMTVRALARELRIPAAEILRPLSGWAWRFAALFLATIAVSRFYLPAGPIAIAFEGSAIVLFYFLFMIPYIAASASAPYLRALRGRVAAAFLGFLG